MILGTYRIVEDVFDTRMNFFALFISHQQIDRVYRGARCQQFIDEH